VTALEPGLYRATVRGELDTMVLMGRNGMGHHDAVVLLDGVVTTHSHDDHITDARPLIVLDLADYDAGYVIEVLRHPHHLWANRVADQIEAQTKPAKIEEPPQGKRVEANLLGFPSWNEYLHIGTLDNEHWVRLKDGNVYAWDLLTNPQVVTS